jgi:hypothetical protein
MPIQGWLRYAGNLCWSAPHMLRSSPDWTRYQEILEVIGFAYVSHAAFLVLGRDRNRLLRARASLLSSFRLPRSRVTELT